MLMHPIPAPADPRPQTPNPQTPAIAPVEAALPAAILATLLDHLRQSGGFCGAFSAHPGFETRPMSDTMQIACANAARASIVLCEHVAVASFAGLDGTGMAMTSIDTAITKAMKTPPAWAANDAGHMSTRLSLGAGRVLRVSCQSSIPGARFGGIHARGATLMLSVLPVHG
ncbi:hypothetical protein U5922_005515 [Aquicoccus sp. G2-2]|uniref:hypothetical protein n=1 Tax=Aquicoccus sp. G2-2 TaxID=3092120 RepID=UPI002AE02C42|nr:hypothetical protein [Aquicoccus sp. G2-2]MEA1112953.1 hypothetical protein [Aquicoccus sp. G2-2]